MKNIPITSYTRQTTAGVTIFPVYVVDLLYHRSNCYLHCCRLPCLHDRWYHICYSCLSLCNYVWQI